MSSIPTAYIDQLKTYFHTDTFFITGATGFFGRSLLDFLIANGILDADITVLARNPNLFLSKYGHFKKMKNLHFITGDIQDFKFPQEKFDHIIDFATPASASLNLTDPLYMIDVIINGTRRILEFARSSGAKNVLFASSGAVYGRQPTYLTHIPETYNGAPLTHRAGSAYGEAKRMAELMGCEYSKKYEFQFKIARCFAFVGPHLDQTGSFAIGNFINDACKNEPITISGDGTPKRSYLYSDDLIVWLLKILFSGKNMEPYNVGSDQSISILELANLIALNLNSNLEIKVLKKHDPSKPIEQYVPNIEKAKSDLNLDVWTDLQSAIILSAKK